MSPILANQNCPLCEKPFITTIHSARDINIYDCPRCGRVQITDEAIGKLDSNSKYILSAYTRLRTELHQTPIDILTTNIEDIISSVGAPSSISEKPNRILLYLELKTAFAGFPVEIDFDNDYPLSFCRNDHEFRYLIGYLLNNKFIEKDPAGGRYMITMDGWKRIEELKRVSKTSRQVFVAMRFSNSMRTIYDNGIKRAIEEVGYNALKIDLLEHNDPIDDRILIEIRRSRFVVADFTEHRGGVYFEAGYALALGIPVIWMCKKEDASNMHFDVRQFSRIEWDNENDLYEKLKKRIVGSIF